MPDEPTPSPAPLDYARATRSATPGVIRAVLGLAVAAVLLVVAWRIADDPAAPVLTPVPPAPGAPTLQAVSTADEVFEKEISPRLHDYQWRNAIAIDHAIGSLRERMEVRRQGVAHFARDITSWSTRFGVIKRKTGDGYRKWVKGRPDRDSVNAYVSEKFRRHILSEQILQADVTAVMLQLDEELAASRNRLYADLYLPLSKLDAPVTATEASYHQFQDEVRRDVEAMASKLGTDSVTQGLAAFAGGWIVGDVAQLAVRQLVTQIIARTGTQLAVQGVAAGGATAGGAGTGGGVGSFGGPVGTVIGVGVGIAVGAAVDWWMSNRFEQKLIEKCNGYLDDLRDRLIDGTATSPGLEDSMRAAIRATADAQRASILRALQPEQP